ncbi:MAG: intradiol ring-cleavage dioxygenase [Actinomycetota bacterium]|nr:intradiol ring-cleavage dioxygenase [Actinomycetota bacterium]
MSEDVRRSRALISRRRALSFGGTIGLGALLAACGGDGATTSAASAPASGTPAAPLAPSTVAASDIVAALDAARTCTTSPEQTQGPYWFDVDSLRSDIREQRPGTVLQLALRVHDVSACSSGGQARPVTDCVVEIWHCDAGGIYSGFESGSIRAGGVRSGVAAANRPGSEATSDGSYASGDQEGATTDDGTYLRGAQVADSNGIVQFTTVFPGWYPGRTPHIHLKVHLDRETVLTTQLYVEDEVATEVYAAAPYNDRTGRNTRNREDNFYREDAVLTVTRQDGGRLGLINLGVEV